VRQPVTTNAWLDDTGLVTLPSGPRVRGRRQSDTFSPADFAPLLADGPMPARAHRHIRWPDSWIPINHADVLDTLREAYRRAHAGERVEVTCRGGIGRTGTALAALAILDGLPPKQAVTWIRPTTTTAPWKPRGNDYGFAQSTNHPRSAPGSCAYR